MLAALDAFLARQFSCPEGPAGRFLLGPLLNRIGGPMMRDAARALDAAASDHVLDLGFGGGALAEQLLRTGAGVTGVDRSAAMVARAVSRNRRAVADGRAHFLQGSAEALPLPDGCVTKAASVNTLYFWPDLAVVMRELARVLKPAGRLVLCFQTAQSVRQWPGHVHGFHAWDEAEVHAAVVHAGFAVQAVHPGFHRRVRDYRCLVALRADA